MLRDSPKAKALRLTVIGPDGTYRDGAEQDVLSVLQDATDLASDSDELAAHVRDWPTRYHLSRRRANLLRPLHIGPGDRVLDVGAGTGVLTRYLGETGADVVALEPSVDRARAAATRCADLPNVRVVSAPLDRFADGDGFDLVVSVGVLEYAAATAAGRAEFLTQAARLLRSDGVLLVAIENQLGLRYLLGYGEDHLNEPWAGVEDYGGQNRVRTFGRRTLARLLHDAGFLEQRWLYPFPDYKLPSTIVDEAVFTRPDAEEFVDKIVRWPSSGEATGPSRLCDDRRAHQVLLREGLGTDVANSFLVLAARTATPLDRVVPRGFLAQHMGWERRRLWRGWKRFEARDRGAVVLSDGTRGERASGWLTRLVPAERPFVTGPSLEQLALNACREGEAALGLVLAEWRRHLAALEGAPAEPAGSSPFCQRGPAVLPRQYLDVVLGNFIRDASGALHYVDDEWRADGPVDADLVCARALFWFAADLVTRGARHPFGAGATVNEVAARLGALSGVPAAALTALPPAEAEFQALVTDRSAAEWGDELTRLGAISQATAPPGRSLPFTTLSAAAREAADARERIERELADRDAVLAARDADVQSRDAVIAAREADLAARDAVIADHGAAIEAHRGAIADRDATIARRDAALADERTAARQAQADAAAALEALDRSQERMTSLDAEIARLGDDVRRLVDQIERQGRQRDQSRHTIDFLQRHLDEALSRVVEVSRSRDQLALGQRTLELGLERESARRAGHEQELAAFRAAERAARLSRSLRLARRLQGLGERIRLLRLLRGFGPARRRLAGFIVHPSRYRQTWRVAARLLDSGLFDPDWYAGQTGLTLSAPALAFHYELAGRWQARTPSPLFDTQFYLEQNPDVAASGDNPLLHYLDHGAMEGRKPFPLFDSRYYLEQHPDLAGGENPLIHFLRTGGAAGARPCPLFDTAYYLRTSPDVAAAGLNPLVHYLQFGAREGRDPNPYFDTSSYLERYPDVAASGMNPLVHYVLHGSTEGRSPGPGFDAACYLAARPDVAAAGADALDHLLRHGLRERGLADVIPAQSLQPDVHVHLDVPATSIRVKRNEPVRVGGWIRSDRRAITAVVIQGLGASRFWFDLPLGSSAASGDPRRFEANLRLPDAGMLQLMLGARLADGSLLDVATLPPVTVEDDVYCAAMTGHLPTTRCFSVLYLDGMGRAFQSPRYRIDNMREALALAGIASEATDAVALHDNLSQLRRHDVLVLFRAGWDWRLEAIVDQARAWNIPVVFDVDDYVFEPAIATAEHIAGIRDWTPEQVEEYQYGVRVYRRTLESCDYFTGSSDYLVEQARALGRQAYLLNNHLNARLVALGEAARTVPKRDDRLDIVYISGTKTHQADFATIVPALADLLRERPQVHLRIVGYLDLQEYTALQPFAARIHDEGFLTWEQIPERVAGAHITIAPLERGNPFCEAKSELKYFEGAAFGLAVVATPTDPFRRAIRDGETGFLCDDASSWRERLFALVDDAALRARLTEAGCQHALARFGPAHAAAQASAVYRAIIADWRARRGVAAEALAINWVMLDPFAGSGGHNDIFIAANEMVERGHAVTLFFGQDERQGNASRIREYIERHFGYPVRFQVALGYDNITNCDALIATHYTTADVVKRLEHRAAVPAYFVQDYEPYFSPVSTEYFAAEQTYRAGLLCVTLGPWLRTMVERHGAHARHISFWVDPRFYHAGPARAPRPRPRVLYFARPQMARRCYDLGLAGLAALARQMPEVEICLFGAATFPGRLDFPHTALGILTPAELGNLYRGGDVGLAFSTTNPSLVTFEMMACGLPLVDLDVFDSRERHGGYPALLVQPSPEAIAEGVARLLADEALRSEIGRQSVAFTAPLPTASRALAEVSAIIEAAVGDVAPGTVPAHAPRRIADA